MFKRGLLILIAGIALTSGVATAQDAGASWSAWLYDREQGHMRLVQSDGTVPIDFVVMFGEGAAPTFPAGMAVSRDGTQVIYSQIDADGKTVLRLDDTTTGAVTALASLPEGAVTSLNVSAGALNFNQTDTTFAFGYTLPDGAWGVSTVDLPNGAIHELSSSAPSVAALNLPAAPVLPVVREYRGAKVMLTLMPTAAGSAVGGSYTWDTTDDSLTANDVYPVLGGDTFSTRGEIILPWADTRLPRTPEAFPTDQNNSLQVYDPSTGTRVPFYNDPKMSFQTVRFIESGDRILAGGSAGDGRRVWTVISRDGRSGGTIAGIDMTSVAGTGDGFIYTTGDDAVTGAAGTTALVYAETRAGLPTSFGQRIWVSPAGEHPTIVWVSNSAPAGIVSFPAWAQLVSPTGQAQPGADGVTVAPKPTVVAPVAPAPQCPGFLPSRLVRGQQARVTPGTPNPLRASATASGSVIGVIPPGGIFRVLGGPVCAVTGAAFWQVVYNNVPGWVAEGLTDQYWTEPVLPEAVEAVTIPLPVPDGPDNVEPVGPVAVEPVAPSGQGPSPLPAVGGTAIVTLAGDNLRLRTGPGSTFVVADTLPAGTVVQVVDGPRTGDGYRWWRVQLAANPPIDGWVADGLDGVTWLAGQ